MFSILMWLVCGWIAGSVAFWLLPPKEPVAGYVPIAVGIAGSIAGGIINAVITGNHYSPAGIVWSCIGAVAVTAGYRWYTEQAK